jgi:hypothetical protein
MDSGFLRAIQVWHRRSGKDKTDWNFMIKKAFEVIAPYYYFFPTYSQGKKALWDGIDNTGFKFLDHIPKEVRVSTNDTEMKVKLINGSLIQVVGTDNIDSIVGTNPRGCVFSEYSLQDPKAWQFVRPILAANGGWAIFNYTPRMHNHAWELLQVAKADPIHWYWEIKTADDTKAIPPEVLAQEKIEMAKQTGNDALYEQEYFCSFEAPVEGAYYGSQLMVIEKENHITDVPYDHSIPVETFWDLGVGDTTAIWFLQRVGMEKRFIDYYETNGEGLDHYVQVLQDKKYIYAEHTAPHDIEVRELSSGKSRLEIAKTLGIKFNIAPKLTIEDGINASRSVLSSCWFDKTKCDRGLNALKSYHKEWDEDNKCYKNHPEHDWSSNGSDAFRYFAVSDKIKRPYVQPTDFGGVKPFGI